MTVIGLDGRDAGRDGQVRMRDQERDVAAVRERLNRLAVILDSAVLIPGTRVRVGGDAALNLIPVLGTIVAKAISGYIVFEAHRMGVPKRTLARMGLNVGIDLLISAVPVAGWIGDIFYRANLKNIDLLKAHLDRRSGIVDGQASRK